MSCGDMQKPQQTALAPERGTRDAAACSVREGRRGGYCRGAAGSMADVWAGEVQDWHWGLFVCLFVVVVLFLFFACFSSFLRFAGSSSFQKKNNL